MQRNSNAQRRILEFQEGDLVLLSSRNQRMNLGKNTNTKKLLPRFIGPFQVTKRVGKVAYTLGLPPSLSQLLCVFHVSLLRPFVACSDPPPIQLWVEGITFTELQPERIIDHRDRPVHHDSQRTQREFLVRTAGHGHEYDSWESEDLCRNICEDLIEEYYFSVQRGRQLAGNSSLA